MARMTGQQIYQNFQLGMGSQGVMDAATILSELQQENEEIGEDIRSASVALEEHWEGDAGEAARRGAGPLAVDHQVTAEHANTTFGLLSDHSGSFDRAKSDVVPVPDAPESPPYLADIVNDPAGFQSQYQQHQANLEANNHNARVMDRFDTETTSVETTVPNRYGSGSAPSFAVSPDSPGTRSAVDASGANGPGIGSGSGIGGGAYGGASGRGAPGGSASTVPVGQFDGSGLARHTGTSARERELPANPSPDDFARRMDGADDPGRTTQQSVAPPVMNPVDTPGQRPPTDVPAARSNVPGSGPGVIPPGGTRGATPGSVGGGTGGRLPAGGRVAGGVPGAGQQPGRFTGGQPGAGSGGATAAARGAGMAGAGRGGIGPGMMGGAGGRGQGGEDEEHTNKYAAKERLEDGLLREYDELGERIVDEQTGKPVLSPVLGHDDAEETAQQTQAQQGTQPQAVPAPPTAKPGPRQVQARPAPVNPAQAAPLPPKPAVKPAPRRQV